MNENKNRKSERRFKVLIYDIIMLAFAVFFFLYLNPSTYARRLRLIYIALQYGICALVVFGLRFAFRVYRQILRYGGTRLYIRIIVSDMCAGIIYYLLQLLIPDYGPRINLLRCVCIVALNLLGSIACRLLYQYVFEFGSRKLWEVPFFRKVVKLFTGLYIEDPKNRAVYSEYKRLSSEDKTEAGGEPANPETATAQTEGTAKTGGGAVGPDLSVNAERHSLAIVGAGRIGAMLAKELLTNQHSSYVPVCFIDRDTGKSGREIYGIPVYHEDVMTVEKVKSLGIEEIVFALPRMRAEQKGELYERYRPTGCRILVYDYPLSLSSEFGKRAIREFNIEELLFRDPREFINDDVINYYSGKTVMVTGGGGSIGSELSRQIASMHPLRLILLDIYENGVYEVQQELKMKYGATLALEVEICSVTDRENLDLIIGRYRPDVILHAAAHKHVPLMEHNCVEAVRNNVFGTLNVVECAMKHKVGRFLMVSTDKAVNPTNVMGATKRVCEMIVMAKAASGESVTRFCATRFGNVLGSNGSVVPLFKKQIAAGGPVTVTDRRIIRYFMTIPEATQLVLTCGAISANGELFALDMGKPTPILEMAENMIRLCGLEPYKDIDIVEIGLRPGEKLYEELLINFEELDKTDNDMIFVEREKALPWPEVRAKLDVLEKACAGFDDEAVRSALHEVVPTFRTPEEVNAEALKSREFQMSRKN